MRGVLFDGDEIQASDGLDIRDPGPREVRVRIKAAGVCHSDLSIVNGAIAWPTPVVLGHEGAGVVEDVGAAVTVTKPGDHVVLSTLSNCGLSAACESGHPTLCDQSWGQKPKPFTWRGQPAYQYANIAAFAEYTVVAETQVIPIDPVIPLDRAALLGCGVLTGTGAVFNRARVRQGDRVAVFGVGGIGISVIQAARLAGATRIVAVDTVAAKQSVASHFGATDFVVPHGDVVGQLAAVVPGGFDFTFEAVGHPMVLRNAVDALGPGGHCVVIGVPGRGAEASFEVKSLYQDKGILGCRYGSSRPRADIPVLVDLYLAGRLDLDAMVDRTYELEDVARAFADMESGMPARGVIVL